MTQYGYTLLGLTAVVTVFVAILTFAVLKFMMGARAARRHLSDGGSETAFLSAALQDALTRLQAQERATSARADASEQLSSQIVSSLTAGLLVVDARGQVQILNPAGRRMLAITADPVGTDYGALLAVAPPLKNVIAECLAAGAPILRRSVQITQGGRDSHFGVTVSPLLAESGRGAICLFSDLTAVMELEEQLRLKEALARVGELTAGLAHEFRNGLATIHGYSRLIATEALPAQYQTYLQAIRQETETLGDVVTNFLNFARPEKVMLSRVPLAPLVQRAADDLRRELPPGTTIETMGEFCVIDGDEVLLRQVVGNLIRNAAEACVEAGKTPAISIEGRLDRSRRTCSLSVRDNGPGIPAADRERVFQPFFTTRSRGTGLGLAIVQKIVVTLNGRVAVSAPPGGGASIDLTFPLT